MPNKWQSKVNALILLAEDQAGKPEGDLAKEKLRRILRRFPELAKQHDPLADYADRTFTVYDLRQMKRQGISTAGEWTGGSLDEAIGIMVADYKRRAWGRETVPQKIARLERELEALEPKMIEEQYGFPLDG